MDEVQSIMVRVPGINIEQKAKTTPPPKVYKFNINLRL